MNNQEDYDVNKKIEGVLNPSLDLNMEQENVLDGDLSSHLESSLKSKPEKKSKKTSKIKLKHVLIFLAIAIFFIRNDNKLNFKISNFIIRSERTFNVDLSSLKTILGVNYVLDADSFSDYIKNDNSELVKSYINWGINLEDRDKSGKTALINAIESDNLELTKVLLDSGASLYTQDLEEKYPSNYATGKKEIFNLLVEKGLDESLIKQSLSSLKIEKPIVSGVLNEPKKDLIKQIEEQADLALGLETQVEDNSSIEVEINEEVKKESEQEFISSESLGSFTKENSKTNKDREKPLYEEKERVKLTGVKVARSPKGVFVRTDKTQLVEVVVGIRNFGANEARGVKAELFIPGYEKSFALAGPSVLKAYEQVEYRAEPNLVIYIEGRMRAKVTCDNCYPN